ncbi:MAG TPA: DUF3488 and transglutaminase-like domain-containing protein [Planctomycetota bacterium]|nr:DUF3488 and transglutaminase-like domain-containing protein [Planctomycetota bacterium]
MSPPEDLTQVSRDVRARAAAYAGLLLAYLAAVRNDPLLPLNLLIFASACGWSLLFETRLRRFFLASPLKIGLIAAGAVFFVVLVARNAGRNTEHFANTISNFLFWNAVVFVLSRNKSEYDLWTLAIIELSLFMISGSFVQPPAFLPLLLGAVACLLYTFHRTALLRCGPAAETRSGAAAVIAWTLVLTMEAAALLFVVFPRQAFRGERPALAAAAETPPPPALGADVASKDERTGIPQNPQYLELASYSKLKQDPRAVLKVRVRDLQGGRVPPEKTPYLRGALLDTYQGGRWRTSALKRPRRDTDDGQRDGWVTLETSPPPGRLLVRQQIHATAHCGELAFLLPDAVRVQVRDLRWDPAGAAFFPAAPKDYVEYFAESALVPSDDAPRRTSPVAASDVYLQVPPGLPLLRRIAEEHTRGLRPHELHAKAGRLQHFLMRNGFRYQLGPFVPAEGKDAVEHFLEKREGYCTHFATALVLLCRAAGVPARVATGFQLHDPDEDGAFLVRNSDAHAWAEVWFGEEHGWRAYDATPAEGRTAAAPPEGAPVASTDDKKKDEGPPRRWDAFLLEFDRSSQGQALRGALSAVAAFVGRVARAVFSPAVMGTLLGLLAAAAAVYGVLPSPRRRRLRQLVTGFKDAASVDFYRDLLWALARRGVRKHPALTPHEFARQARVIVPDDGIDFVTAKFYEVRYGGAAVSPADRRRIDEAIVRIARKPRDPSTKEPPNVVSGRG